MWQRGSREEWRNLDLPWQRYFLGRELGELLDFELELAAALRYPQAVEIGAFCGSAARHGASAMAKRAQTWRLASQIFRK